MNIEPFAFAANLSRRALPFLLAVFCSVFLAAVPAADAAIWYVNDTSTTGDSYTYAAGADTAPGGGPNSPLRSIQKAIDSAAAGDTIYIDAGLYDSYVAVNGSETAGINITKDSIVLIGKDSMATVLDPPGVSTLQKLYGIFADTQTGITVKNIGVTGAYDGIHFYNVNLSTLDADSASSCGNAGIYMGDNSDFNTLKNNTTNSIVGYGIYLYQSSNNNTVRDNTANSNVQHGIYLAGCSNNTLSGNTFNSNSNYGIYLNSSADNNTVRSNTVKSNSQYGIRLLSSSNNSIVQNTLDSNVVYQIYIDGTSSSDTVQKNNIRTSQTNSDSGVYNASTTATNKFDFTRNWWGTTDELKIKSRIYQASNGDSVTWIPYRFGDVDTLAGADTTAPAKVTITLDTTAALQIKLSWTIPTLNEETNGGAVNFNGLNIFRLKNLADTTNWHSVQFKQTNSTETFWIDTDVTGTDTYYYRATSKDSAPVFNESFFSDTKWTRALGGGGGPQIIQQSTFSGTITAPGPDTNVVLWVNVLPSGPDTLTEVVVRLLGPFPPTGADTVSLYRETPSSTNGIYDTADAFVANLTFSSQDTWRATGLSNALPGPGGETYIIVVSFSDTAGLGGDTVRFTIPGGSWKLQIGGNAPGAEALGGTWTKPGAANPAGLLQILHGVVTVIDVAPGETLMIRVLDTGVNTNATLAETFTIKMINLVTGEQETPVLTEKDTDDAIFEREFRFSGNSADSVHNSGRLYILPGDTVRISYTDPGDASDTKTVNAPVIAVLDGKSKSADTQVNQGDTAVVLSWSVTNELPLDTISQTDTITGLQATFLFCADTWFAPFGIKLWEDTGVLGVLQPNVDLLADSRSLSSGLAAFTFPARTFSPGDTRHFLVSVQLTDTAPLGETIDAKILKGAATHSLTGSVPDTDMNSAGVLVIKSGKPNVHVSTSMETITTPAGYSGAGGDTIPGATMTITLRYDNDGGETAVNFSLNAKIPQFTTLGTGTDSTGATGMLNPHTGATITVTITDDTGNVVPDTDLNAQRIKWTFSTGIAPTNGDPLGVVDAAAVDVDAGFVKYKVYIK